MLTASLHLCRPLWFLKDSECIAVQDVLSSWLPFLWDLEADSKDSPALEQC